MQPNKDNMTLLKKDKYATKKLFVLQKPNREHKILHKSHMELF